MLRGVSAKQKSSGACDSPLKILLLILIGLYVNVLTTHLSGKDSR